MHSISRATAIATLAIATTASAVGIATAAPALPASAAAEPGHAIADDGAAAQQSPEAQLDQAVGAMTGAFSNAKNDGTLIGTAAGVIIGCPVGAVTGGTLTALVSAGSLTPIGVVGGCILGGATLGGLGGAFGGAVTGIPALADAAGQQYNRLHAQGLIAAPGDPDTADRTATDAALPITGAAETAVPHTRPTGPLPSEVATSVPASATNLPTTGGLEAPTSVTATALPLAGGTGTTTSTALPPGGVAAEPTSAAGVSPASIGDLAAPAPVAGSGDVLADLNMAWHAAGPYIGLAAGVGGTAGALVGAVVGCPIGAITLGSMATVMSAAVLTVPGVIGGCLAGAGTTAAFGGMAGSVMAGLPVGLAVTAQKFGEIQADHAAAR
ncbi:hypothetical protein [Nocardia aurantia]|uniref:Uncharacterized protein n=1 Tax=Nocardia aurantia TaxID=2585199 RepID=A0A7K0DJQ4_9NOCA|nr:hypothetical protein [Nocardia aurantia]MQY25888.1 hypothetical protein [Nocardia aurantia]